MMIAGMVPEIAQILLLEIAQSRQGVRIENSAERLGVQGMVRREWTAPDQFAAIFELRESDRFRAGIESGQHGRPVHFSRGLAQTAELQWRTGVRACGRARGRWPSSAAQEFAFGAVHEFDH